MPCKSDMRQSDRKSFATYLVGRGKFCAMGSTMQQAVAVRLAAIMKELKKSRREMAEFLEVGESRLGNWLGTGEKANMPSEAAMARLCEKVPLLTMDYIYLGRLDAVPYSHAIRLKARELGLDPDDPGVDLAPVAAAVGLSNRRA